MLSFLNIFFLPLPLSVVRTAWFLFAWLYYCLQAISLAFCCSYWQCVWASWFWIKSLEPELRLCSVILSPNFLQSSWLWYLSFSCIPNLHWLSHPAHRCLVWPLGLVLPVLHLLLFIVLVCFLVCQPHESVNISKARILSSVFWISIVWQSTFQIKDT